MFSEFLVRFNGAKCDYRKWIETAFAIFWLLSCVLCVAWLQQSYGYDKAGSDT